MMAIRMILVVSNDHGSKGNHNDISDIMSILLLILKAILLPLLLMIKRMLIVLINILVMRIRIKITMMMISIIINEYNESTDIINNNIINNHNTESLL